MNIVANDGDIDPVGDWMLEERPGFGGAARRAFAAIGAQLFGSEPACLRVGRYVVLENIGRGGMGEVFRAYDPVLQREVAVKSMRVHDASTAPQLLHEARAMAQLSHPNLLPVFDVGVADGRPFLAMELVDGFTLRGWIRHAKRRPAEIIAVFVQAGRGLAAAHAAGLIHGDFKPDNVLLGRAADERHAFGRVRVMDFGLARIVYRTEDGNVRVSGEETGGAVVFGTPPYMPPEQLRGHPIDAASDQYSFCVALFEAIYGSLPFEADTLGELLDAKSRDAIRPIDARRGPAWLLPILRRGMAAVPGRRWPSMADLLAAIERRRARRLTVAAGVAATLAVIVAMGDCEASRSAACADLSLAGVWDDQRRGAVRSALLASERLFVIDTWARVEQRLDAFAGAWNERRANVCEGPLTLDEHEIDVAVQCLQRGRAEALAIVETLEHSDPAMLENAIDVVAQLEMNTACDERDGGDDSQDRSTTEAREIEAGLFRVRALTRAGRYAGAAELAEALLARTKSDDDARRHVELLVELGRAESADDRLEAAERHLTQAFFLAASIGFARGQAASATALANLVSMRAPLRAQSWIRHARASLAQSSAGAAAQVELLCVEGVVLGSLGNHAGAVAAYEDALARVEAQADADPLVMASVLRGLAHAQLFAGDTEAAERHAGRALALLEQLLGAWHPQVADALHEVGAVLMSTNRIEEAIEIMQRALEIREASLGSDHRKVGLTLDWIGHALGKTGAYEAALPYGRDAVRILRQHTPTSEEFAAVLNNYGAASLGAGRWDEARASLREALDVLQAGEPGHGGHHFAIEVNLALALHHLGRPADARRELDRAREHGATPEMLAEVDALLHSAERDR